MEAGASAEKRERKPSRREMKSKSVTLPAGTMLVAQPGEGFFTKIRRCLRLRSKGKYDLSNSSGPVAQEQEDGTGSPSSRRSRSTESPVRERSSSIKVPTRSSPQKTSRRSKSDKEEVVLIRKDKRSSSGLKLGTKSYAEGSKDDVLVVTVGDKEPVAGASGVTLRGENKENQHDVVEEIDPDYETLDNIRRKVRSQGDIMGHYASPDDLPADKTKTATRQPLQVKIKASYEVNGRDSGLDSPFTDSPGSSKESQAHSVASSVFSNSAVLSDNSERSRDSTSTPSVVLVNGAPVLMADSDPMVTSTSSLNCSNSALEEDDLYSNAKVLIRKKSQKQSLSQTSLTTAEQRSSGLFVDQPMSQRNSLTPADLLAMMEAESSEGPVPPPLPARNYSEEDLAARQDVTDSQCGGSSSSAEPKPDSHSVSGGLNSDVSSETCDNGGARPKTTRLKAFVEEGPVLTMSASQSPTLENNYAVPNADPTVSTPQDTQTTLSPTDNIYEDIPARLDTKDSEPKEPQESEKEKKEDDLLFIDQDPSPEVDYPSEKSEVSELPDDVMIVSASDSMCGNETDDSHGNSDGTAADGACLSALSTPLSETSPAGVSDSDTLRKHQPLQDEEASGLANPTEDCSTPKPPSCSNDPKEDASTPSSSSSSPHHLSVSSPSDISSLTASSSDTLNNVLDNETDPDDWEGRDESPPVGPPIHVSLRQLRQRMEEKRKEEDEPPPLPLHRPHRRLGNPNATPRNVKSMEIPFGCLAEHYDRPSPPARPNRRHSSSVAASKAHRDFLESMRQLKDCGWYWGPLSYEESESKLIDKRDGSFLVRDSSNENYILSLSFKSMGQVHHTRIEHHKGLFSFWSQPDSHGKAQICQFIEQTVQNSKNGRFLYFLRPSGPGSPPLPIQLLYPVSRFCRVPSLQHMCRFLVLRRVRRDHIDHLPLPQKVKAYLLENQYYVETLEEA